MKKTNLQPWLDYFDMLQTYERNGYLQLQLDKHEAYVTQPALHSMSKGYNPQEQLTNVAIIETVRRLQVYAAFRSTKGMEYMKPLFAIHVVQPDPPHDPLCTILLSLRRRWFWPFRKLEHVEVINYDDQMKSE